MSETATGDRYVAGHKFVETPQGEACAVCGRRWLDILNQREFWRNGEMGIAHHGALNDAEVAELNDKLDRMWSAGKGV